MKLDSNTLEMASIIKYRISEKFAVPLLDMSSKKKERRISHPRMLAMFIIRQETDLSLVEIGKLFGNRGHDTVTYACRRVRETIAERPDIKEIISEIIGEKIHKPKNTKCCQKN